MLQVSLRLIVTYLSVPKKDSSKLISKSYCKSVPFLGPFCLLPPRLPPKPPPKKEEKISPKATLTIKKQYTQCGHVINEYKEIPEELVNLTKKELEGRCENYEIEKFSTLSIILQKEESGFCGEHYILKQKDDVIAVYKIKEDGTQSLEDVTGICVEYLTENDKMQIKKGITVYGKEELNSMLEDYE